MRRTRTGLLALAAVAAALAACSEQDSGVMRAIARQEAGEQQAAERFLEQMRTMPGVTQTQSGLLYRVVRESPDPSLPSPGPASPVLVHYEGKLPDGTVFDSSYARGQPAQFPLNQVIPGWTEGVQLMRPGDEYVFYIPPELGYGPQGSPPRIPPNSALEFRVELLALQGADGAVVAAPGLEPSGG